MRPRRAVLRGRRPTVPRRPLGALTALLCLGLLAACGSGDGPAGYVNDGAAGPEQGAPSGPVAPDGKVDLHPLDKDSASPGTPDAPSAGASAGLDAGADGEPGTGDEPGAAGGPAAGDGSPGNGNSNSSGGTAGGTGGSSGSPSPGGPPRLDVGTLQRTAGDERWCEQVSFEVTNTGGAPVTSGTVDLSTHILGPLGVDWGTVETQHRLKVPVPAGEGVRQSFTVCVDSWRVPLGWRVETREVDVDWK